MERLLSYDWPGNIRELMNLIERIFIDPPRKRSPLPIYPSPCESRPSVRQETVPAEREILLYTLSQTNWNKSKAAERLHWSRMTLYRKIAKYHIVESHPETTETAAEPANRRNNFTCFSDKGVTTSCYTRSRFLSKQLHHVPEYSLLISKIL